jgi:methionyl aminopeptidase
MIIRTAEERAAAVEAGRRLGAVLEEVAKAVRPGATTRALDELAEKLIRDGGDLPAFQGYTPAGAAYPYPTTLCVSVNDEVVHGIAGDRALVQGDIVSLDLGLSHEGIIVDSALTVPVGGPSKADLALMRATEAALEAAMDAARPGARTGDLSHIIGQTLKDAGVAPVRDLGGHGVGLAVHEEPFIANDGHEGTGPELEAGMMLALEPIANTGKAAVILGSDGYTYRTKDGSRSSHHEHTILVEEDGPALVLTRRPSERR